MLFYFYFKVLRNSKEFLKCKNLKVDELSILLNCIRILNVPFHLNNYIKLKGMKNEFLCIHLIIKAVDLIEYLYNIINIFNIIKIFNL